MYFVFYKKSQQISLQEFEFGKWIILAKLAQLHREVMQDSLYKTIGIYI